MLALYTGVFYDLVLASNAFLYLNSSSWVLKIVQFLSLCKKSWNLDMLRSCKVFINFTYSKESYCLVSIEHLNNKRTVDIRTHLLQLPLPPKYCYYRSELPGLIQCWDLYSGLDVCWISTLPSELHPQPSMFAGRCPLTTVPSPQHTQMFVVLFWFGF